MAVEIVKAFCQKHSLEYEAKSIKIFGVISKCPKCKEELEKEKEQEALRQAELEKKQDYEDMLNYLERFSNIPKRYIKKTANLEYQNFKKYRSILEKELEKNLFIIGDTGVGKTFFIAEIFKRNWKRAPYYIDSSDLNLFNEKDFRLAGLLEKIDGRSIIAIDEVQMLCTNERIHILESIICRAYSNGSVIILCGNGIKEDYTFLSDPKYKRMTSRFKDGGVNLIDFGSGDLRI